MPSCLNQSTIFPIFNQLNISSKNPIIESYIEARKEREELAMKHSNMLAMILAGGRGSRLHELTNKVAKPAVSYGGKYRIVDFPLSNCANSGIDIALMISLQLDGNMKTSKKYNETIKEQQQQDTKTQKYTKQAK